MMSNSPETLRDYLMRWLHEQGHQTELRVYDDRFSEILFRAQGLYLIVRIDQEDPQFLFILARATLPDNVRDELPARRAMRAVDASTKVVKLDLDWDGRELYVTTEQLTSSLGGPDIFWRCVSLIRHALGSLHQAFDEQIGRAAASAFTAELESELTRKSR